MDVKRESQAGALRIKLFVPPYSIEDIQSGMLQQYTIYISASDRARINKLLYESHEVITYVDGACVGNPGQGGASAAFFSRTVKHGQAAISASDSE